MQILKLARKYKLYFLIPVGSCLALFFAHYASAQDMPSRTKLARSQVNALKSNASIGSNSTIFSQCGSSAGGLFPSAPVSNLCSIGNVVTQPVSAVGKTQFQWTCGKANSPEGVLSLPIRSTPEVCVANRKYNGECGAAIATISATAGAPTTNLCALGQASIPALSGNKYSWTCIGVLPATGATVASCSTDTPFSLVPKSTGGFYDVTECVKENATGLIWEGKPLSGPRAANISYQNFDDLNALQYLVTATHYPVPPAFFYSIYNSATHKTMVNGLSLCGSGGWRIPSNNELLVLNTSRSAPGASLGDWMPNFQQGHWSSTPYVGEAGYGWRVQANGYVGNYNRLDLNHVRLVSSSE